MLDRIKTLYPVKYVRKLKYNRKFERDCYSCFRGVFDTFSDAYASAPPGNQLGFNITEFAEQFTERAHEVYSYDYPVLFWIKSILGDNISVFDFGGNIGVHYYAYQKYMEFPQQMRWVVCEVPEVADAGRKLALENRSEHIVFTSNFKDSEGSDLFISAGALQYIENPSIAEALASLENRPGHLLLNKLPLYDGPQYVTLQNAGISFVAQYVFNRRDFIKALVDIGYELVDMWRVHELDCSIPFHPEHVVKKYSGLYLRLGHEKRVF